MAKPPRRKTTTGRPAKAPVPAPISLVLIDDNRLYRNLLASMPMAMNLFGIDDIRWFFSGDERFLEQFR